MKAKFIGSGEMSDAGSMPGVVSAESVRERFTLSRANAGVCGCRTK